MSNKKRCASTTIGKDIGWDAALLLEWLRFCVVKRARFLKLIEMDGETWIANSYPDLNERAELFELSPAGKPKKMEGTIGKLVKAGLLKSSVLGGNVKLIAIDSEAIVHRYGEEVAKSFKLSEADIDDDEKPTESTTTEHLRKNGTVPQKRKHASEITEVGSAKTEAPIYIGLDSSKDSKEDSEKDSASSVEEGSVAPPEIFEKPANTFLAVAQIAFHGFTIDDEIRKEIKAALGKINNTRWRGMQVFADVELVEDYTVWRMLVDKKGWKGFPTAEAFAREFSYEFLAWYESQTNKQTLQRIKQQFPSWRQDLFARDSDYVAFRKSVQDTLYPKKGTVTDRHPWKQDRPTQGNVITLTEEQTKKALARLSGRDDKETGS